MGESDKKLEKLKTLYGNDVVELIRGVYFVKNKNMLLADNYYKKIKQSRCINAYGRILKFTDNNISTIINTDTKIAFYGCDDSLLHFTREVLIKLNKKRTKMSIYNNKLNMLCEIKFSKDIGCVNHTSLVDTDSNILKIITANIIKKGNDKEASVLRSHTIYVRLTDGKYKVT